MRYFACTLVLLLAILGHAAEGSLTLDDARLSKAITVTEQGDRFSEVLRRLSKKVGVKLSAASPLAETMVVCRYHGKLLDFMEVLAHFFATSSKHTLVWISTGDSVSPRYQLTRPKEATEEADQLRFHCACEMRNRMEQAIKDGNPLIKWFGKLPASERYAVYAGERVTHTATEMGGRPFLEATLEQNADQWGDQVSVTYFMTGRSPLGCLFNWSLKEENEEGVGQQETTGAWMHQICPDLAPLKLQQRWRERYGDPAPTTTPPVHFFQKDEPKQGLLYRKQILLKIAERAGVNLIADDREQTMDVGMLSEATSLSELLNRACQFSVGPPGHPEECHASFWRKVGDTYLVRSLAWLEEEQ